MGDSLQAGREALSPSIPTGLQPRSCATRNDSARSPIGAGGIRTPLTGHKETRAATWPLRHRGMTPAQGRACRLAEIRECSFRCVPGAAPRSTRTTAARIQSGRSRPRWCYQPTPSADRAEPCFLRMRRRKNLCPSWCARGADVQSPVTSGAARGRRLSGHPHPGHMAVALHATHRQGGVRHRCVFKILAAGRLQQIIQRAGEPARLPCVLR